MWGAVVHALVAWPPVWIESAWLSRLFPSTYQGSLSETIDAGPESAQGWAAEPDPFDSKFPSVTGT